jgi:nitrogen fixation/metabolism regulation signal transduction histidine kinase
MKKRRRLLVKKEIQMGIAWRFLLITVLFSLFVGFEVYISIWNVVSYVIPENLVSLVKNRIFFRMLIFAIPVVFVIVACSIVYTHRIVGPLTRLEGAIQRLARGEDVDYINVRKTDELRTLASAVNDLIKSHKSQKATQD